MITDWTMKHDKRKVMEILGAVKLGGDAARLVNTAAKIKPPKGTLCVTSATGAPFYSAVILACLAMRDHFASSATTKFANSRELLLSSSPPWDMIRSRTSGMATTRVIS